MEYSNGIFYSANDFFLKTFGKKAYKISVSSGCTCPNRDGSKGTGGCVFCNESGSGDFASASSLSLEMQLEKGKNLVSSKAKNAVFIAYFQNFTNTYGDFSYLSSLFSKAVCNPEIAGLSVATRPDCLSDEMLYFFSELSEKTFVMLELGLQTVKNESVKYINRCYENNEFSDALRRIKSICPKIHVVSHLILGLPNETKEDMFNSIDFALSYGTDGLKLSLLHILKNTRLAQDFFKGIVKCLSKEEYFEILSEAICKIPKDIVIHRVTGDGAKRNLISPLWTADKKRVFNDMFKYFKEHGVLQGRDLKSF